MTMKNRSFFTTSFFATFFFTHLVLLANAQAFDSKIFSDLKFRYLGVDGNRTIAVVGEAGNPMVSYVGAASGGIFKTEDGGLSWKAIFDDQDVAAVGALAIAPSNQNQIWCGTGESFVIRPAHPMGNGVYKSSDGGKTWQHLGLEKTARIGRIVVHPTDTNIVYVAALGSTHAPQQERGVYKTTDGGKTWARVFFLDENTGCNEIEIDPTNPSVLFAAMWQIDVKTWKLNSGGASSGIYRSTDAGKTWEAMNTRGIEFGKNHPVGKTSVCIAPSNSNVVSALVEDKEPRLYRSDDGGNAWNLVKKDHSMAQRAPYYTRVRVSTGSADEVYTICVQILKSKDGGKTWAKSEGSPWAMGGDCHDMWFDPKNPNRQMVAHDGCMNMSLNGGKSWKNINLPIAQLYHVAVDNEIPYNVMGNRQDGYSYRAPSLNRGGYGIPLSMWQRIGGCESGFAQADPRDANIIWSGCYDGGLDVTDMRTGIARDVRVWPETQYGWKPADVKFRWHWNFPMVISKHRPNTVWVGSQYIHQTTNSGQSWQIISPDLTTNDPAKMDNSGGMANDNLYTWDGCTTLNMAESPVTEGVLWVGTNDGLLHLTRDGGKNWANLTKNIPNLPEGGTVSCIEPSSFDAATCYVSYRFIYIGNTQSYIFKTTDFGKTWTKIIGDLPQNQSSTVFQIKEDPSVKGLLYAGTDNAVYFSPNDGKNWIRLKGNLPSVAVYGIAIPKHFGDLVLGTYGRGFYILDDLTPIREFSEKVQKSDNQLFTVRPTYRFIKTQGTHAESDPFSGQNPMNGAIVNFYQRDTLLKPAEMVILTEKGDTLRKLKAPNKTGVQRLNWDLRLEAARLPKLRTKPRGKDWVEMDRNGERSIYPWDLDMQPGLNAPLVPVGKYRVQYIANNKVQEQIFEVKKDPISTVSEENIKKQYEFGLKLNADIKATTKLVEDIEAQRALLQKALASEKSPDAKKEWTDLENQLYQIESGLLDIQQTGARQDNFRNPVQVLERFLAIGKELLTSSGDHPPTDQQVEVHQLTSEKLKAAQMAYQKVLTSAAWKKLDGKP
jgi:photosystem II stability/assembly factor-like uncharacterized protein